MISPSQLAILQEIRAACSPLSRYEILSLVSGRQPQLTISRLEEDIRTLAEEGHIRAVDGRRKGIFYKVSRTRVIRKSLAESPPTKVASLVKIHGRGDRNLETREQVLSESISERRRRGRAPGIAQISITLPSDLAKDVKHQAKAEKCPRSKYIVKRLQEHLAHIEGLS